MSMQRITCYYKIFIMAGYALELLNINYQKTTFDNDNEYIIYKTG